MCKKVAIGAVAVAAGLLLLSWAGLGSYVTTAWNNIRTSAKRQVPLEFEIERVRTQVAQLVPDMNQHRREVAEEMVAIDNLRDEVAVTRTNLIRQKENLQTMARDLDSGAQQITYDGKEFSRERISEKLSHDFASYKNAEAELKAKEKLLATREKALDAAREQLAAMRQQKQDLEVQVEQLEAELKNVRLAQTQSKFSIDDSQLSQCKATLAEIRNRLKVEEKSLELRAEYSDDASIPVEKKAKPTNELTKEVKSYFGGEETKVAAEQPEHK